jgi:hypothetical protein
MVSTLRFDKWENDTGSKSVNINQVAGGGGLVPVIPTSITVVGGTATVSDSGLVSFANATDIQLNQAFTSTYQNYRAIISFSTSASSEMRQRYSVNGAAQTSASFSWAGNSSSSNGTSGTYSGTNIDWGAAGAFQASSSNLMISDITNPFSSTQITRQNSSWGSFNGTWSSATFSLAWNANQTIDGIRYYVLAGNMTGTVKIYGYN